MITEALGTIETIGLTAAIEAADTAVKAADVKLVGYELTNGQGMVTVKLLGQVAAVKAAIDAAKAAAGKVNQVVSTSVIPRPNESLHEVVLTKDTVGYSPTALAYADPQAWTTLTNATVAQRKDAPKAAAEPAPAPEPEPEAPAPEEPAAEAPPAEETPKPAKKPAPKKAQPKKEEE